MMPHAPYLRVVSWLPDAHCAMTENQRQISVHEDGGDEGGNTHAGPGTPFRRSFWGRGGVGGEAEEARSVRWVRTVLRRGERSMGGEKRDKWKLEVKEGWVGWYKATTTKAERSDPKG